MKLNMKKAFTLVEMLIVIVIIGILAAALIPRLTGIKERARDVARKGDLQQISTALAIYNLDNNRYITGSVTAGTWYNTSLVLGELTSLGLMKSLPSETNTTTMPYLYTTNVTGSVFGLMSLSEWGGVNANYYNNAIVSNAILTGGTTSSSVVTNALCASVTQWTPESYTAWWACKTDVNNKNARYLISN